MNKCVEEQLRMAKSMGAPLLMEVVKAIASLCGVDPYVLWEWIYQREVSSTSSTTVSTATAGATSKSRTSITTAPCWRCPACGKTFDNPTTLARHILYFVKMRDRAHLDLYREIKNKMNASGRRFNEVVQEFTC